MLLARVVLDQRDAIKSYLNIGSVTDCLYLACYGFSGERSICGGEYIVGSTGNIN